MQGGTDVVGHLHDKLEWEVPPQEGSEHDNRFRCLWQVGEQPVRIKGAEVHGPRQRGCT